MATYVLRRLIQAIPILIGISVISFLIIHLAPGDPTDRFRSGRVSPETIANLIRMYGLDKPLPEQFISWFTTFWTFPWNVAAWGYSFVDGRPVVEKIFDRIPFTLELMLTSLIVTMIVSIPLGVLAAVQAVQLGGQDHHDDGHHRLRPAVVRPGHPAAVHLLDQAEPVPLLRAPVPRQGGQPAGSDVAPVPARVRASPSSRSRLEPLHAVLDAGGPPAGLRAHGQGQGTARLAVLYKHALKNALLPVITLLGLSLPSLLAGAAITESIFSWPGLGFLAVQSVTTNDFPIVLAIVMMGGMMVLLGNLLADVLYGFVDPRIKY